MTTNYRKLKVYMGTNVIKEFTIQDKPVGVTTIFDTSQKPFVSTIAVAAGSSIFYFKDLSPTMKYDLPLIEFSEQESQIWAELIKVTTQQFATNEDATESSQEMDQQTISQLLEKLF